jgi:hypothetical protein
VRNNLGEDAHAVQTGESGRDCEHSIEGQQFALRERQPGYPALKEGVYADEDEEHEDDVGEQGDR